ncbi:hypothetical protein EDD85DRAFT_353903 [Armillaria nabsnona]|nr:hypothetical protein EDD85DRAFT_353903 [Armillaria nabsnona]
MDPISLLTGIPDLIERGLQCYELFKSIENAPVACLELMNALGMSMNVLEQIKGHVFVGDDLKKIALSAQVEKYQSTLDSVSKAFGDKKLPFLARVKWVRSDEKKLKALKDDLNELNTQLSSLITIEILKGTDAVVKHIQKATDNNAADKLAERRQNVINWLEPLDSQAKQREVNERRQPATCEWLSSHARFVSWYKSSGSFLWLNGIPGNGKTVFASFVIDHLKKNVTRDGIVLFAFADFQDVRSTDVVVLLRTLLAQLLDYCKAEDLVEDRDFAELEKTMQQHADPPKSVDYLIQLLERASTPWNRMFIVIDALDECARKNRGDSIAAIRKLAPAGSKISIFVTSRAEQDIVDVLNSVPAISLVKETKSVKEDIGRVIENKMKTRLRLARLEESLRFDIASTLLEKSNGMFRLVDCQLDSLDKPISRRTIYNILRNLPADLNSMYERILQGVEALEDEDAVQIVQHTLWWLVGSHRRLRLAEIMEAVTIEIDNISPNMDLKPLSGEHLLEMCSSLVRHNIKTDILTLSHATVQDFLFSDYLKGTVHHDYHIPSISFLHQHTTGLISAYLQYRDFQNGPCTTEQQLLGRLKQHPFLVYVVSNWDLHIVRMYETCTGSEEPPDFDKLLTLFESEKNLLAQRSRRQVSYFGTKLRNNMKGSFSKLESQPPLRQRLHRYFLLCQPISICKDIGGFVYPHRCAGPSWLFADKQLLQNHPLRDLSNTTSIEELDYIVYPLVSQGPTSLVRDLLHRLPQFKERPLFYFGTPLMISIFAGKLDTVKMLLQDLHVDVDTCAWHYDCGYEVVSPIFLATKYGHIEAVKLLLQHGSPTVFPSCPKWFSEQKQEPEDGLSDIIIGAANYNHADVLQILIDHGVDKNTRSSISDNTVLHAAVKYGHLDSIKVLIEAGCDISLCSKGKTPLDLALNQQSLDIVQYLLDKGASFDQCLPQIFEDLEWAVREPWYPETRKYLVTPGGGGPKSQQDIKKIVCLLEKLLPSPPPYIIRAILDFAELWIVNSAERHKFTKVNTNSPYEPYIFAPPIAGSPENPVRRIVFMTVSAEEESVFKRHTGGLYSDSTTWFEAGVESIPSVLMRIQDNISADNQCRTHINVWDYQDAPSSIKEWMSKIKAGDKISVYPRVGDWQDNIVESAKITVYTSCV